MDGLQFSFSSLPEDIAVNIASRLEVNDLCALGSCSRFWRWLCDSDHTWESLVRERWPLLGFFEGESTPFPEFEKTITHETAQAVKGKPRMAYMPLWVNFHGLPLELFTPTGLSYVASGIGRPICLDEATEETKHLRYARVFVLVDVKSELSETVDVVYEGDGGEFEVRVEYPLKPEKCSHCLILGHSTEKCFRLVEKKAVLETDEGDKTLKDLSVIKDQISQLAVDASEVVKQDQFADQTSRKEWRRFYEMQHIEMADRANTGIKLVKECSVSNALEGEDYFKAFEAMSSMQFAFQDVVMFFFKPNLNALLNLISVHYCIRQLTAPGNHVADVLMNYRISGQRVFVKWRTLGKWRRRGMKEHCHCRNVSLMDLAMGKEESVLQVLQTAGLSPDNVQSIRISLGKYARASGSSSGCRSSGNR